MYSPPSVATPSSFLPSLPTPRFVAPFHAKIGSLGVLHPSRTRICGWRSGRRKEIVVKAREEEDAFAMAPRSMDVEAEIYEFMRRSAKPMDFPTRDELVAAGRADLAETVAAQGGWLTFGWDLDDGGEEVIDGSQSMSDVAQEDGEVYQERVLNGSLGTNPATALGCEDRSAAPSFSGRSLETENLEDGGVEGILSRLEKERSLSLALASRGKVVNGRDSWRNAVHDPGYTGGKLEDVNGTKSSVPDVEELEHSKGRFFYSGVRQKMLEDDSLKVEWSNMHIQTQNSFMSHNGMKESFADKSQRHLHLQHLEADLSSALWLVRSRANGVVSHKHQGNSIDELHRPSDAWEFQETEIVNARDKLQSVRAKLAVLEGNLSFKIMEARKVMEERQKRIDAAQNALHLLRTAYIVWPNSSSEVLLAGSFDGWTGQRRMERSSSCIFTLQLKLYPGRYEIKFIVDGVWKTDPLHPIVHNNGHENNLLIVD
ncbi:protein FLOURY ENDOSPERM 6, chloroplastic-like isoform X2 [Musa acuminata AAA Group]|uniref:protein FLOURY ENDOSPERM 6, chloroplastic-like isoform X2 n=1 Tax=Musa acuminata AAA Group TaxID=214697 RepID=UPI0031DC80BD